MKAPDKTVRPWKQKNSKEGIHTSQFGCTMATKITSVVIKG